MPGRTLTTRRQPIRTQHTIRHREHITRRRLPDIIRRRRRRTPTLTRRIRTSTPTRRRRLPAVRCIITFGRTGEEE